VAEGSWQKRKDAKKRKGATQNN
jgi:hypothetical protein